MMMVGRSGFDRYLRAPYSSARMAPCTVGSPVISTTGTSRSRSRTARNNWNPSSPGMLMSLRMASKRSRPTVRKACAPSPAVVTWKPARWRQLAYKPRTAASSSTTSIVPVGGADSSIAFMGHHRFGLYTPEAAPVANSRYSNDCSVLPPLPSTTVLYRIIVSCLRTVLFFKAEIPDYSQKRGAVRGTRFLDGGA